MSDVNPSTKLGSSIDNRDAHSLYGGGGGIEIIRDAHSLYLPGDILRFPLLAKYGLQDTIVDILIL